MLDKIKAAKLDDGKVTKLRKRKGMKGPNPLSCKKKQKKAVQVSAC